MATGAQPTARSLSGAPLRLHRGATADPGSLSRRPGWGGGAEFVRRVHGGAGGGSSGAADSAEAGDAYGEGYAVE